MPVEQIPVTAITNPDKAWEVAYASKEQRCLAVASRLTDAVLGPFISTDEPRSFVYEVEVARALHGICQNYPEAFSHVFKGSKVPDQKDMLNALPVIIQHGGVPVKEENHGTYKRSADELDAEAEIRETVAVALFDTPPNTAFIKDHDLQSITYKKTPVEVVFGLLGSVKYYTNLAETHRKMTQSNTEYYERDDLGQTKMQVMLSMLDSTSGELKTHLKNSDFTEEVKNALNDENTDLAELRALWLRGRALVVHGYLGKAAEIQHTYDMIVSGEAATYTTPE